MICCAFVSTITACTAAAIGITFALNYSQDNFLLYGISWTELWALSSYIACKTIYYFAGYYFIICYHLKQRLNSIRIRLNIIRIKSKSLTSNEEILIIKSILQEHNDICQKIYFYNKYWQKYLTITYSIFLMIICILSYIVLISSGLELFVRIFYAIVLSAHSLLIFIITYSAFSVSDFNRILYKNLCSFSAENYFPFDIRIRVRLKTNSKTKLKHVIKRILFQLRNDIEKLGDNKIGFTLINGVLITRNTFQLVSIHNMNSNL
jgi:hypothetical protein